MTTDAPPPTAATAAAQRGQRHRALRRPRPPGGPLGHDGHHGGGGRGFGKSVALGQALRANGPAPGGRRVAVLPLGLREPGPAGGGRGGGVRGTARRRASPLDRLYAVFADLAPLHAAGAGRRRAPLAEAAATFDELLRRAPANLHLVLSGRRLPPLALARLRAADDVVDIGADDLRFDDAEVAALAASLGRRPAGHRPRRLARAGPAGAGGPQGAVDDYLWEEVVRALDPSDRRRRCWRCASSGPRGRARSRR